MNIINLIMKLYPPAWRERYEEEMRAVLEEHHYTLWTLLDLFLGALDARMDPHYNRENPSLSLRSMRVSNIVLIYAFAAAVCCASLWLAFPTISVIQIDLPRGVSHLPPPPLSLVVAEGSYQFLFLLLIVSNLFIVGMYVRHAIVARQRGRLLLAAFCFVLPIVIIELIPAFTFNIHSGFWSLMDAMLQIVAAELLLANMVMLIGKLITTRALRPALFIIVTEVLFFIVPALFQLSYFNTYTFPPDHKLGLSTFADFGTMLWWVQAPFAALATAVIFVTSNQLSRQVARTVLIFATLITLTLALNILASLMWSASHLLQGQIESIWISSVITVSIVSVIAMGIAFVALRRGFVRLGRMS